MNEKQNRSSSLQVKLSDAELEVAKGKAELAHISVNDLIRNFIVKGYVFASDDIEMANEISSVLNPIEVNIRQIISNINDDDDLRFQFENAMKQFREIREMLSRFVFEEVG